MLNRHPIAASLLVASVASLLGACSKSDDKKPPPATALPSIVRSDDGKAELTIPAGAMPDGLSEADITVTTTPTADFPDSNPGTVVAAFTLLPAGTIFSEPLALRVTLDEARTGDSWMAFLEDAAGTTVESAAIVDIAANEANDRITSVTTELSHFSSFVLAKTSAVIHSLEISPAPDTVVGSSFTSTVTVVIKTQGSEEGTHRRLVWNDPPWKFATLWESAGPVTPTKVKAPFQDGVGDHGVSTLTFTCNAVGLYKIHAIISTNITVTQETLVGPDPDQTFTLAVSGDVNTFAECLGTEPTGTSCSYGFDCGPGEYCGNGTCAQDSSSDSCADDSTCPSYMPACTGGQCAQCNSDTPCANANNQCLNNHCVECDADADCTNGVCSEAKVCEECRTGAECTAVQDRPLCSNGTCSQCASDSDCGADLAVCGSAGLCVQCTDDSHCGAAPFDQCKSGRCSSCAGNDDCAFPALPGCANTGCTDCFSDSQCGDWAGYVCAPIGLNDACSKECTVNGDCAAGHLCIGGNCAQCNASSDCPSETPVCGLDGFCYECDLQNPCTDGRYCRTDRGYCMHCMSDDHCVSAGLPACSGGLCGRCSADADCTRFDASFVCKVDGSCAAP